MRGPVALRTNPSSSMAATISCASGIPSAEVASDHEAFAAHLDYVVKRGKGIGEMRAHFFDFFAIAALVKLGKNGMGGGAARGLPPKVVPWSPGRYTSAISARAAQAPWVRRLQCPSPW